MSQHVLFISACDMRAKGCHVQLIDEEIYEIIEKGLEGNGLDETEVLKLYEVEETSREAALLRWAGKSFPFRQPTVRPRFTRR